MNNIKKQQKKEEEIRGEYSRREIGDKSTRSNFVNQDPLVENVKGGARFARAGTISFIRTLFSFTSVKLILTVGVVIVLTSLFFILGAFGGTKINLTLNTNPDLEDGLVGHWTFDGGDLINNVVDSSGNGNTGYLDSGFTSTTTVAGKIGQALSFDGTNDTVEVQDSASLDITGDLTISLWAKQSSGNGDNYPTMFNKRLGADPYNTYVMGQLATGQKPEFCVSTGGAGTQKCADGTNALVDDVWIHLVGVYDGSNVILYVDGVFDVQTAQTGTVNTSNQIVRIGSAVDDGNIFEGDLDDVRIYNRALSPDEILRLYGMGATTRINTTMSSGSLSDGLVAHYTFDGGDLINNVVDSSGNGNTGYLTDFTSTTTVSGRMGQALDFNGSNDFVTSGLNLTGLSTGDVPRTITAWIKPNTFDTSFGWGDIVTTGNGDCTGKMFSLGSRNGLVTAWGGCTDFVSTLVIATSTWSFVAVSYNGSDTVTVWLNENSESASLNTYSIQSSKVFIGAETIDNGSAFRSYFDGSIDDVRIYDRALSADEISRLYGMGATTRINTTLSGGGLGDGLVVHYTFDGRDLYSNVADVSGNGNTGYLGGFTSTTTAVGAIGQALYFDGSDDYVNSDTSTVSGVPLTMCAWFSLDIDEPLWDNTANPTYILDLNASGNVTHHYYLGLSNFANLQARATIGQQDGTADGGVGANSSVVFWTEIVGEWHHICGLFISDTSREIYYDGVLTGTDTGSKTTSVDAVRVGNKVDTNEDDTISGKVDDARIYDRLLTADEIQRLYDLGR